MTYVINIKYNNENYILIYTLYNININFQGFTKQGRVDSEAAMNKIKALEEMRKRKSKVFYSSNTDSRYGMEDMEGNSIENSASSISNWIVKILIAMFCVARIIL